MGARNRGWLAALALALVAASVATAAPLSPAEEPPSDFAGRQYIDSAGCVFLRDGKLWAARLGRDGAPVCGYPPTPVHRATPPQPTPAAPPLDGMGRIEAELVAAVTGGLSAGDLIPAPAAASRSRPAPEGEAATDLGRVMAAAVSAAPAVAEAAAASGGRSNMRLCAMLGLGPGRPQALGGDPTGGFCGGLVAAPGLSPRIASVEAAAALAAGRVAGGDARMPPRRRATVTAGEAGRTLDDRPRPEAMGGVAVRRKAAATTVTEGMIPAGTRFLQVGSYPGAEAAAALRRVAALGLPVVRGRDGPGGRLVMAGPFADRRAVVRAHDRLTRAGFRGLVPRP